MLLGVLGLSSGIARHLHDRGRQHGRQRPAVTSSSVATDGLSVSCQNQRPASRLVGLRRWHFLVPFAADQSVTHAFAKAEPARQAPVRDSLGGCKTNASCRSKSRPARRTSRRSSAGFAVRSSFAVAYAPATSARRGRRGQRRALRLGYRDGQIEVTDGGKIDRMVTFDKPGTSRAVVAFNGKQAVKQAGTVKIKAPRPEV